MRRLAAGAPEERAGLALALGRIGASRGRAQLELLLADRVPEVRRLAAFSLGLVGDPAAAPALLAAAAGEDRDAARAAVEALARLGTPLPVVEEAVRGLPADERMARLLPPLFRFPAAEIPEVAVPALEAGAEARRWAGYALARNALSEQLPRLLELLDDSDPWLRGWAARAIGTVGGATELPALRPLLDDPQPGPVVQALRAAARRIASGAAAAPEAWAPRLAELLDDPRSGVRLTAVEGAGGWLPDPLLGPELRRRAREGEGRERELALLAVAAAADPEAAELVRVAAADPERTLRARAAEAAGSLGLSEVVERLASDAEPMVRLAALAARLNGAGEPGAAVARAALSDGDPAMRAAALEWLAQRPAAPVAELERAIEGAAARRMAELRLNGARALAARARAEASDRPRAIEALETLAREGDYPVRRAAARLLGELGLPEPAVGSVETGRPLRVYREMARSSERGREVELRTRHGVLRLRLFCGTAPLTCLNFAQLAGQGFYDGLTFHRVVPDFVVQTGDPRGDGWGGPGYTLRDENSPLRYTRGAVGMALSGPDTGGSQFFIALSDQPHLEGAYPLFGRVVEGADLLDRIVQGDRIESAAAVDPSAGG